MKRKQPDDVVDTAAVQRQQEPAAARAPRELSVDEATAACDPEFWLSCVHDTRCDRRKSGCDLMTFSAMVHDKLRMRSYERDIWATVRGKRVLEVGTGALAPLTQMCLAAGATEVVTVERSPWAAEAAAELLVPHRNCRVITGDATALTVADTGGEGRFDVLVHGKLSRSLGFTRTCATHTTRHYTHQGFHCRCEFTGCTVWAEVYGCVAGAEGVLESCAALRRYSRDENEPCFQLNIYLSFKYLSIMHSCTYNRSHHDKLRMTTIY